MAKSGPQRHDCYFKKYISILTNKDNPQTKTEQEKQHTKSFKKYDFTAIITDIAHKHKIIETFPDYNLDDKKVSEMILYLFYPHAQLAKTTLQRTNIFMIDDYADDLSKKLINRYNENEQALEFFEYEPLNEALTFETNDVLKKKIYTRLNNFKNSQVIYEKLYESYNFLLTNELFDDKKGTMFFNKQYSGLVMHLMPIKNKFSQTALDTDILYNYMNYCNDVGVVFNDDIISKNLLPIYNNLFDKNSDYYIELEDENKVLEQQFLDMYFGVSAAGYVINRFEELKLNYAENTIYKLNYTDNDDIECSVEDFSRIGIFGLSDTTKNIINIAIEKEIENQKRCYNKDLGQKELHDNENLVTQFIKQILDVFYEFVEEFVRYLYIFGNYEKRINYVKDLNLAPPKMTDDWRYLQNPKCDESNIISCYIDSLHSLSFLAKYTFNKKHYYINDQETYPIFAEIFQAQQCEEKRQAKKQS